MKLVIYNPNSKGGNYDYALRIAGVYATEPELSSVHLLLPWNADVTGAKHFRKILFSDIPPIRWKLLSQLYFLFRSLINPFILFLYLITRSGEIVLLFNDYDQPTSMIWSPLFRWFKGKKIFGVVLHDPDRDLYFSSLSLSQRTMRSVMKIMDVAFYHDVLPSKPYYENTTTEYISVPHGLYTVGDVRPDSVLTETLRQFREPGSKLISALGNIREEKNYKLIIRTLTAVPDVQLFICGTPANTSVDVDSYRKLVGELSLERRVLIVERYINNAELRAVVEASDAFIMYYGKTFQSQSGMLNLVAPYRKPFLVSDNGSPLSLAVKRFNLGLAGAPDSEADLASMLKRFSGGEGVAADWDGYFNFASWENFVSITMNAFKHLKR
jgi:glycosyltransferase involved in cell wall biosynthesis